MTSVPYETPNVPPDVVDQRGGMNALGIVLIVIGALAGCLAAFTPLALLAPLPPGMAKPMARDVLVGAATYAGAAVLLVTAGVGSIRGRRWSRPVILIITGTWAVGGLMGLVSWL